MRCGLVWSSARAAVFFMPTIVACRRGHFKRGTTLLLNILVGWSGLGWLVIMFWSATGEAYK